MNEKVRRRESSLRSTRNTTRGSTMDELWPVDLLDKSLPLLKQHLEASVSLLSSTATSSTSA